MPTPLEKPVSAKWPTFSGHGSELTTREGCIRITLDRLTLRSHDEVVDAHCRDMASQKVCSFRPQVNEPGAKKEDHLAAWWAAKASRQLRSPRKVPVLPRRMRQLPKVFSLRG